MPSIGPCSEDLLVLITGTGEATALSLLLDIVEDINVNGRNVLNKSPISEGSTITDHIVRQPDTLRLRAIAGCSGCKVTINAMLTILPLLKRITSRHVYDATFLNIFWNMGVATNMVLKSYSISYTQKDVQIMNIQMAFEAANIQGEISAPSFRAGGFLSV